MNLTDYLPGNRRFPEDIERIKDLFPSELDAIERLYEQDAEFRSLCADYYLCDTTLDRLNREAREIHEAITEYKETSEELMREISQCLGRT